MDVIRGGVSEIHGGVSEIHGGVSEICIDVCTLGLQRNR